MNKSERIHLEQLVLDCDTYRLSEKEALEYISTRFRKSISARHYYRMKKKITSEDHLQDWLNEHARIGFVIEHKKRIDEIEIIRKALLEHLKNETLKPISEQDRKGIIQLFETLLKINQRLTELSIGTPILQKIKKILEEKQKPTLNSNTNRPRERIFK